MAVSESHEDLDRQIEKISAFIDSSRTELEKHFSMLCIHGKPKDLSELQRRKLIDIHGKFEEFQKRLDVFQTDLLQACGINTGGLRPVDMRKSRGRTHPERESGYQSANISQVIPPDQSFNRLSIAETNDTSTISDEANELYDPSISGLFKSTKEVLSFYIESPASSIMLVDKMVQTVDLPAYDNESNPPEESTAPKTLNDLSKPPSEEDNTKLANDSSTSDTF